MYCDVNDCRCNVKWDGHEQHCMLANVFDLVKGEVLAFWERRLLVGFSIHGKGEILLEKILWGIRSVINHFSLTLLIISIMNGVNFFQSNLQVGIGFNI